MFSAHILTSHMRKVLLQIENIETTTKKKKKLKTNTSVELTHIVVKNNYFQFLNKTFKQKRITTVGTKFTPPYSISWSAEGVSAPPDSKSP